MKISNLLKQGEIKFKDNDTHFWSNGIDSVGGKCKASSLKKDLLNTKAQENSHTSYTSTPPGLFSFLGVEYVGR